MPSFTRPDPTATCNPRQLAQLLGVEVVDIEGDKVHVHGTPPANAQDIINAYVYDPYWNDPDRKRLNDLNAKPSLTGADIKEFLSLLLKRVK